MLWIILAVVLTAALVAAGCGSSGDGGSSSDSTSAGGVQKGGTFSVNVGEPASKFGFPLAVMQADQWYEQFFLESMFRQTDQVGEYEPTLATSWDVDQKEPSVTFQLREGVKFTDGTDFNADAVKFCWDQMLQAKLPSFALVTSVEVVDPLTVKVMLRQWDNTFLANVARGDAAIYSPTAFQEMGPDEMMTNPVGTGPWVLDEFIAAQIFKVKKNPDYWDAANRPNIDEVIVEQIVDPMTALSSFKAGEVQGLNNVDPVTADELTRAGTYAMQDMMGPTIAFSFNSMDPKSVWSKKEMREALEYAIDKEGITQATGLGFTPPSYEICKGISEIADPGTAPRTYDPEKAKELMAEAGYPDGIDIKLTYEVQRQPKDTMAALVENLNAVGIRVELNGLDGAAFNALSFKPAPGNDLMMVGMRGGAPNVLVGVNESFAPTSIFFPGIKRPDGFVPLLETALAQPTMADGTPDLVKMEQLAYGDAMVVPLWVQKFVSASDPNIVHDMNWFQGGIPQPRFDLAWVTQQ
jgi:peptide/nickel transport system substrate-binding protein